MTTPDKRPTTTPPDWYYRAEQHPGWCPECQHHTATIVTPYHLTRTGVDRHPLHTRCWNCGHWQPTNQ